MLCYQSIDETDLLILKYLIQDATQSHKAIGQLVHLTGQAVGARVRKLQDLGIIEGYTIHWNPSKIGQVIHAFITVFMKSGNAHHSFLAFVQQHEQIIETHRVSGEGCYWMRVRVRTPEELSLLLNELLQYGNYKVSLSIDHVK